MNQNNKEFKENWECNNCGFQEYTDAVSQHDLDNWLQCSNCGENEFHLVPVTPTIKINETINITV